MAAGWCRAEVSCGCGPLGIQSGFNRIQPVECERMGEDSTAFNRGATKPPVAVESQQSYTVDSICTTSGRIDCVSVMRDLSVRSGLARPIWSIN